MSMEPPLKRKRLARSSSPNIDLHARRAQNDSRLKSIFESIFEKYGKDFDGIGDEIDLKTGEIVVNNGHIQGMTNERDTGGPEYSTRRHGDSDHEDDHSWIEYSRERSVASGSSKVGDTAVIDDSGASEQSNSDAGSLMGDVPDDSHLQQLGKKARGAVSIPSDNEVDELASSDIEWASCNKGRRGVQDRFGPFKHNFAFVDEPAVDPAWRAPPLPNIARLEMDGGKVALTSIDNMREYSDDERAGISLWTPEVRGRPVRRQASANSIRQRSLSFVRGQENNNDVLLSHSSDSEASPRKRVKWTQEEEELLTHLKPTTNLYSAKMKSYFPGRQSNSIGNHWTLMINRGKASPKSQVPTVLGPRIAVPSLSSNSNPLPFDENCPKPSDHDTIPKTKDSQTIQQQVNGGLAEAAILVHSSSKPVAHVGDHHINPPSHTSGDHQKILDDSVLIPDGVGAHIGYSTGEPFSSAKDCGRKIAESEHQINLNVNPADADQRYGVSKLCEVEDESSLRGKDCSSKTPDQALEVASKQGCGARESSVSTSIKAGPDSNGGEPFSDGIVSAGVRSLGAAVTEALNSPARGTLTITETQRERSIPPTAEDTILRTRSMTARMPKTRSTNPLSTTPAQPSNPGKSSASQEPNVDGTSKSYIKRPRVQVVIRLASSSQPHIRLPLATTESEDPASSRQRSATVDSASAALSPSLPHQEKLAIRTFTRSPSVAAAESQYAASTVFVQDVVRASLGSEVVDSQPMSTMPVIATPMPEVGDNASRPIILDDESPPLSISPGVAPSSGEQLKEATKGIISECSLQPLRMTSVMVTPARKPIEEATEPDILESGSHPSTKPTSAARSLSKRAKKVTLAKSSSLVWPAIEDCSEDELSCL